MFTLIAFAALIAAGIAYLAVSGLRKENTEDNRSAFEKEVEQMFLAKYYPSLLGETR